MKKIITALALAGLNLHAQSTNGLPLLVAQTNVITTTFIQPVDLTPAQMDAVIGLVQSAGVSSSLPITSTNLQSLMVLRRWEGTNGIMFHIIIHVQ